MFVLGAAAAVFLDRRIGLYELDRGGALDIALVSDLKLRWRRPDGTSGELTEGQSGVWNSTAGWTGRDDGRRVSFSDCAAVSIHFDGMDGRRVALDVREHRFESAGVALAGRLVLLVVIAAFPSWSSWTAPSNISALDFYALQRMFPSAGIGVFVYDKRGAG